MTDHPPEPGMPETHMDYLTHTRDALEATTLASLFQIGNTDTSEFAPDPADELDFILETDLTALVNLLPEQTARLLQARSQTDDVPRVMQRTGIRCLHDLILHPRPPLELLHLMKNFGKAALRDGNGCCRSEVGRLLYYTSIALALQHQLGRISSLNPTQLTVAFNWATALPWIPSQISAALQSARERICSRDNIPPA